VSTVASQTKDVRVVPPLTAAEQELLLDAALAGIAEVLRTRRRPEVDPAGLPQRLREPGASFVTLRRGDRLLGCIGALEPYQPLGVDVVEHAVAAAFGDPRFPGIDVDDFEQMSVEISVLGPQVPLPATSHEALRRALRPGVDGLVVSAPGHRATFLPSVWQHVRDVDDFCALLWRKAGLAPGEWPAGIRLSTYHVQEFERPGPRMLSG
jgi:AmmeMemoRadiSam system protein A